MSGIDVKGGIGFTGGSVIVGGASTAELEAIKQEVDEKANIDDLEVVQGEVSLKADTVALNAESYRAMAAESNLLDISGRPTQNQIFHRTPDDPLAIAYDPIGGMVVPYDQRGYARIGPGIMFFRESGEASDLRFFDKDDNQVEVSGGSQPSVINPKIEVVFSANSIDVNIHQYGSKYTQWRIRHIVFPARVADVWRILGVFEADRSGAGSYAVGQELFNNGEVEMAIAIQGKAELIGGTTHGGEMLTDFYVLVDGAAIDHTQAATIQCSHIEMFQSANMFEPGPSGGPAWPPSPDQVGVNARHWTFGVDGLALENYVQWSRAGFGILHGYFGMSPMRRMNGSEQITETTTRSPTWQTYDVSGVGAPDVFSDSTTVKVWGDEFGLSTSAVYGWDSATRNVRVWNAEAYNKVYFDYFGGVGATVGVTTEVGTTWDVKTNINVTIKDNQ